MTGRGAVRALISDFGGVLTTQPVSVITACAEKSGVPVEDLERALDRATEVSGGRNPLLELEKGAISENEFLRSLEDQLGDGRKVPNFRESYLEQLRPNRAMIEYVRALPARDVRMALLTNSVREWAPHWRRKMPDVDELFEVVVDSSFVGLRKPEREIYALTLERLGAGLEAGDCVFVDDLEANCEAAREVGMHAVLFLDADQAIAELEAALGPRG